MNQKVTSVVYQSFNQVLKFLTKNENYKYPAVQQLLKIDIGLDLDGHHYTHGKRKNCEKTRPFIVIEGLDGCGKTSIVKLVSERLGLESIKTPTSEIRFLKEFFNQQPEDLKRAYFSFGNYLASKQVLDQEKLPVPVIMDRYWHSTAASAIASLLRNDSELKINDIDLNWPSDLLKPDLVILMNVSEEERLRRHNERSSFTNTQEEQIIASDPIYRQNLLNAYKKITGPKFIEIDVNNLDRSKNEAAVLSCVSDQLEQLKFQSPSPKQKVAN